jgi:hypothetical protein
MFVEICLSLAAVMSIMNVPEAQRGDVWNKLYADGQCGVIREAPAIYAMKQSLDIVGESGDLYIIHGNVEGNEFWSWLVKNSETAKWIKAGKPKDSPV